VHLKISKVAAFTAPGYSLLLLRGRFLSLYSAISYGFQQLRSSPLKLHNLSETAFIATEKLDEVSLCGKQAILLALL
jgi:hypothetical protein